MESRKGFTLLELLIVCVVITAATVAVIVGIVKSI